MKAFKFRLQALLKKREIEEKELLSELIALRHIMFDEIDKLVNQKKLMLQNFNELREKKKGKLVIESIIMYESFIKELEMEIKDQQRKVIEARGAVEAKNKKYLKASRKRKVVEKYKEKCFEKYKKELLKEEYDFQDEFAVLGHNVKTHVTYEKHRI